MSTTPAEIEVADGAVPVAVLGPPAPGGVPAVVVIPSIFGVAPDLLGRLADLQEIALVVAPDPFWRQGGGAVPYADHQGAVARLKGFELDRCLTDLAAVVDWARQRGNGKVVGLGICFGGPFVLHLAAAGGLDGGVTWHGSRMEQHLDRAGEISCPLRLHFGDEDPVTPPAAIQAIRDAFSSHPDLSIVMHAGAQHGFSHDGSAYDPVAYASGHESLRELIESC